MLLLKLKAFFFNPSTSFGHTEHKRCLYNLSFKTFQWQLWLPTNELHITLYHWVYFIYTYEYPWRFWEKQIYKVQLCYIPLVDDMTTLEAAPLNCQFYRNCLEHQFGNMHFYHHLIISGTFPALFRVFVFLFNQCESLMSILEISGVVPEWCEGSRCFYYSVYG